MLAVAVTWLIAIAPTTDAASPSANDSSVHSTFFFNSTDFEVSDDVNDGNSSRGSPMSDDSAADGLLLDELQLVKLIVLVVVVGILLLSTCTFVLRTFSIFDGKKEDGH